MGTIRPAAVAGKFYPASASDLREAVTGFLDAVPAQPVTPKAVIVPHAGYIYSGPIAATAYAQIKKLRGVVSRVILLGPAHYLPVTGLAASSAEAFSTPLGEVPVDVETVKRLLQLPQVSVVDAAHAPEHCLEVQLPFLQEVLGDFSLVPLLVGMTTTGETAEVIDAVWDDVENLIVISSDLSHHQDYETATRVDAATSRAIADLDPKNIGADQACGHCAIDGLLSVARQRGAQARVLDVRNSGDTAGPRDQVVGYGAYTFE